MGQIGRENLPICLFLFGGKIIEEYYKIWLSLIKNLGIVKFNKLINKFKSIEQIYNATESEFVQIEGIGEKLAKQILEENNKKIAMQHLKFMKKNGIRVISILDKEYPKILKNIYDPPVFLYVLGNVSILNGLNIAVIGCRDAREYGIKIAQSFSYNLSKNNINIVSGLARGIDASAHIGAVLAKQKTIAVLGNGVDYIYPKENIGLAKKIVENGGAIISEYPLGTKPEKRNFVARNRIISGLSKGILVVEAKEKSGTLITVDFALEEGRDVLVIPGDINLSNSFGTNNLIKQGAKLVTEYNEILEEYFDIKDNLE